MSKRAFYSAGVGQFLQTDTDYILSEMVKSNSFDLTDLQRNAWLEEIAILKRELVPFWEGRLMLEFTIPRMGKRVDAVVIYGGIVFLLEFKVGDSHYRASTDNQVLDYALDLKNFHKGSKDLIIVPMSIPTAALPDDKGQQIRQYSDGVCYPIRAAQNQINTIIQFVCDKWLCLPINGLQWENSEYMPTPTIIEAAQALYSNHNVKEITRTDAGVHNLCETTEAIKRIIEFNYSVASTEDQTAIFGGWSSFLNYFDCSLPFQLSFVNRRSRSISRYKVNIPAQEDDYNSIRGEFVDMLKNQIAKSNNGIVRSKYITFGLPADGIAEAKPRLERVESDVIGNLSRLGVPCEVLDGRDRLAVLHGQMYPGSREPFRFSWKDIPKTGMGTKDFIAPDSFDFRQSRTFRVGQHWGAASYLQILASELSDKLLAEILDLDAELTVTMHVQTVDQLKAIKTVKGKISDIGRMKVEEQKKAVRAGYDMDILPPDLITFSKDAAELLSDLQSRNERMFLLTFTIVNLAPTRQRLENDVFTVSGIAQKYNCAIKRLDCQQEQAFVSSLVLGYNGIEIQRGMTTSSTAIFIPFMTRELRMDGQALYYGMNALSHNVIMADRKKLKSANGLYLGSTGSGKSFAAKRELINVFLATNDRIVVVDPMGEYAPLVKRLGGQVIEIAPDSPNHINPMDIQMGINDEDSPLSMKADFLLSLCELIVGGKEGLQPIEKTVIDRCVRLVYRDLALGIGSGDMPLLQDLYEELLRQPEPEAKRVATALELYCTGSLNLFNHHTNVQTDARVVCIVLKNMGENLRKIAMHITNEFVTSAVNTNHAQKLATWCYFDEFHVLLRDHLTASYFVAVWKMLRKKGCVPSALTQNVKDLLASREIENILDNTDFMILLSQAQSDRAILAKQLGISEHQLSYITHANSGEGLLFCWTNTVGPSGRNMSVR